MGGNIHSVTVTLLHPATRAEHLFIQIHYPPSWFVSAPGPFHWPSFSRWQWHFIADPLTHIIKNNLYCPLTHREARQADVQPHTYGNVTYCQRLYSMPHYEGQVWRYFWRTSLVSLYCLCDSWPRGHLPHCAFVPVPIQHYLKPSAAAAAQHNHGKLPLVAAKSAFQQGNSQCTRVEWQWMETFFFYALLPRRHHSRVV